MAGCVFCSITAGDGPAHVVLDDDDVAVGFLDARPLFPGHVLVVPRAKGDGLTGFFWPRTRYADDAHAARIAAAIAEAL